jgi:integrase
MSLFARQKPPPPPATVKLFDPTDERPPADPRSLTLRQAFETWFQAGIKTRGNLGGYLSTLKHWEAMTPAERRSNPPITEIDAERVTDWLALLPFSPETRAKHARHVRAILRRCGPPSDGNPRGASILPTVPFIEIPSVPSPDDPRAATAPELDALYRACSVAKWPKIPGVAAPAYWRAAIVCLYNLGPRCWELLAADPRDRSEHAAGWRWPNVDFEKRLVSFWRPKNRDTLKLPLGKVVIAHLRSIEGDRHAVFPATLDRGTIYQVWNLIRCIAQAEQDSVADLSPHDMRRTCQTEWDFHHFPLGDYITGRCAQDVQDRSYRAFRAKAAEIVDDLPQPPEFLSIFDTPRVKSAESQLKLF